MRTCYGCKAELPEDSAFKGCKDCREKSSKRVANITKNRDELGLCVRCGEKRDNKTKTCSPCREKEIERCRRNRVANPEYSKRSVSKLINTSKERIKEGLCPNCGEVKLPKVRVCEGCWYKKTASATAGKSSLGGFLKELLEAQNYKCYYTGRPLRIGDNASLDHVIPRSHKDYPGDDCLENLCWTTKHLNRIKYNLSEDDLIGLCKEILRFKEVGFND